MSKLNPDAMPDDMETPAEIKPKSPWLMLTTFLLLITGLLFSGFLLLFYGWKHHSDARFSLKAAVEMMYPENAETAAAPEAQPVFERIRELPQPRPQAKAAAANVKWPKLKLSGFGTSADGSSAFAIINGEEVLQGGSIGKVTLLQVTAQSIVLEYMGEKKTLTMNLGE